MISGLLLSIALIIGNYTKPQEQVTSVSVRFIIEVYGLLPLLVWREISSAGRRCSLGDLEHGKQRDDIKMDLCVCVGVGQLWLSRYSRSSSDHRFGRSFCPHVKVFLADTKPQRVPDGHVCT